MPIKIQLLVFFVLQQMFHNLKAMSYQLIKFIIQSEQCGNKFFFSFEEKLVTRNHKKPAAFFCAFGIKKQQMPMLFKNKIKHRNFLRIKTSPAGSFKQLKDFSI